MKEHGFRRGDRLPAEREIASLFTTSRAMIREIISRLDERGILTVKRSSGVFLNRDLEMVLLDLEMDEQNEETILIDHLETSFIIFPVVAEKAAIRAVQEELIYAQNIVMRISQTILAKDIKELLIADCDFNEYLAVIADNKKLYQYAKLHSRDNHLIWDSNFSQSGSINNTIFASYIDVLHAIESNNPKEAKAIARTGVHNICEWFRENNGIPYPLLVEKWKSQNTEE
jgi:DNA-binding FadR family transcriptional regulator